MKQLRGQRVLSWQEGIDRDGFGHLWMPNTAFPKRTEKPCAWCHGVYEEFLVGGKRS